MKGWKKKRKKQTESQRGRGDEGDKREKESSPVTSGAGDCRLQEVAIAKIESLGRGAAQGGG